MENNTKMTSLLILGDLRVGTIEIIINGIFAEKQSNGL